MAEKLKPCPFCGGVTPRIFSSVSESAHFVVCTDNDCCVTGALKESEEDAIAAWNRRAGKED